MRFFRFTLIFLFVLGCSNNTTKYTNLTDFIPENTSIVIKTNNKAGFLNGIENNEFLKNLSKSKALKSVSDHVNYFSLLKPDSELLICFSKNESDSLIVSVITKQTKDFVPKRFTKELY